MTKEEYEAEIKKILEDSVEEEMEIINKAKADGIWRPGLDSNNYLFTENKERTFRKIIELQNRYKEANGE